MSLSPNPGSEPLRALCAGTGVLAVIVTVEGPSYRPLGAMMAVLADGRRVGTLSSGCIEADIALHARSVLDRDAPMTLRYGRGSPFRDIELPCGGGLDVLLIPDPDRTVLQGVLDAEASRRPSALEIDPETGALQHLSDTPTGWRDMRFLRRFAPELRFVVFGKGPESSSFTSLVQATSYPNLLLSPDDETLDAAAHTGCATRRIVSPSWPDDLEADPWTAIVLFFHDHEWEPPILRTALESDAFYIGAQGSRRASDSRAAALRDLGVAEPSLARLRGPVGLVPSARDARTLAVSVLAEILAVDMGGPG